MRYQAEAVSEEAFIQQVSRLINRRNRYWRYTQFEVPEDMDPRQVDAKLVVKYRIDRTSSGRWRDKQSGVGRVAYLRFERTCLLMATTGLHKVWKEEPLRYVKKEPLKLFGYRITSTKGFVDISINPPEFKALKAYFVEDIALLPTKTAEKFFVHFPYFPFSRVKDQQFEIWRAVNRRRDELNLERISVDKLRLRRKSTPVFRA